MRRLDSARAVVETVAAVAAAAACLLPWERLEARPSGPPSTTWVGAFHGAGIAACLGAGIALLTVSHRAWRPAASRLREAGSALAATLLIIGAAAFTTLGGVRPGSGQPAPGQGYTVSVQPPLLIAGIAGAVMLLCAVIAAWLPPSPSGAGDVPGGQLLAVGEAGAGGLVGDREQGVDEERAE